MLKIDNLRVHRGGKPVVKGLSFSIQKGSIVGLLGPNGAGKTTAIRALFGLLPSESDGFVLDDIDLASNPSLRRLKMGYVPQSIALYEELSVEKNLRIWGGLYGLTRNTLRERIEVSIQLANLGERRQDRVRSLSGGMKRRLNLAIGLLHDPDVLICDEPTTGVDAASRIAIYEALRSLKDAGKRILYTTHYFEEVESLCDHVIVLHEGHVLADDSLEGLLAQGSPKEAREVVVHTSLSPEELSEKLQDAGASFTEVSASTPTLESVFLQLTADKETGGQE